MTLLIKMMTSSLVILWSFGKILYRKFIEITWHLATLVKAKIDGQPLFFNQTAKVR